MKILDELTSHFRALPGAVWRGEVAAALGMTVEVTGLERWLAMGDRCTVETRDGKAIICETVGFRDGRAILMAMDDLQGISVGCPVYFDSTVASVRPSDGWLGRVVNAHGDPIDGKGPLPQGEFIVPLRNTPPSPCARRGVGRKVETMVRAVDTFAPLCEGQRIGIFAGSGVGKSTLLAMLACRSSADVNVIGLIGERGREVNDFIQNDLGPEGLARSIIVVATADELPLMRRQAAYLTLAIAEDQRKRGRHVLCMMDSLTRFAMAQREIGLSAGEPPTAKGYPPTVFSELPRLLERAGPGQGMQGDITGVFTVLVDGDDHNEPVADAVRGILDGHLVLSRGIAERGRFPAIDILRSVSRALPRAHTDWENEVRDTARRILANYEDREEIIRIGAYREGSDPETDAAIKGRPQIETFLHQARHEATRPHDAFQKLAAVVGIDPIEEAMAPMETDAPGFSVSDGAMEVMLPEDGIPGDAAGPVIEIEGSD